MIPLREQVNLEIRGRTAIMRIGSGGRVNLLTITVLERLHALVDTIHASMDLRSVIITGAGNVTFLAGADLAEVASLDEESSLIFARLGQSLFAKMEAADQWFIAAVNGPCMGGGMDLLLACDLRYASPKARFAHPGAKIGIITGFGGTARLPRESGWGFARSLLMTGETVPADQALAYGLIDGVVSGDQLLPYCLQRAGEIDALSTDRHAVWKHSVLGQHHFTTR